MNRLRGHCHEERIHCNPCRMRDALIVGALALTLAACAGGLERRTVVVETGAGRVELDVEVADSGEERERGLMGRTELAPRAGMLFLYARDSRRGFWMKDTLIPLSVAFLGADGRILRIVDMEPCRADPCPVYEPGVPYRAAIELNQGAFEQLGVTVGDVAVIDG